MACQILNFHGVEFASRNVLADEDVRNGIKEFSSWQGLTLVQFSEQPCAVIRH
jgi:glutaredoxin-related protein